MNHKIKQILPLFLLFAATFTFAHSTDTVVVDVNLDVKHSVGGISTFDRSKFVTIHSDLTEQEWSSGNNAVDDFMDDFLNGYDVYLGRNTGGITWWLNAQVTEDPNRPGFADSTSVKQLGQNSKNNYASKTQLHSYEERNEQIICAQLHPFWPDGQQTQKGWAFSQSDTEEEPFGTATGEYMGRYIRDFFGKGGTTGQARPNLVEVVNEPMYHLVTHGDEDPAQIFKFHNSVAKEIRKLNDSILIGGFCAAFPDLEKDDFQRWEERWRLFMDMSGEYMDYWSIHTYDFPAFGGKERYRKGAQIEATLDMMEHYSYLKFGVAKPFLVSEFGAQTHDYNNIWSPYRDWLHMKSANAMMLQFMDRPQLITKLINYIMLKAEWGYNSSTGQTWASRLMRKSNEPESYTGEWVYSDMVKMFQLWADVKGTRVDSKAEHLDILCDSYVDGNTVYVILNNLDLHNSKTIKLSLLGTDQEIQSLKTRQQLLVGNQSEVVETDYNTLPESIEIAPEGTLVLEYTCAQEVQISETSDETKYYASEYYKAISANQKISFDIKDVQTNTYGEAILRLGIGRDHGKEIYPEIIFNGRSIAYEKRYKGDDQEDRLSFFGVLEVEIPNDILETNNTVELLFPDNGGYVSSTSMQVYRFSREIKRFNNPITSISIPSHSNIQIIPNPAKEQIRVQNSSLETIQSIEIFALSGKKVLHKSYTDPNSSININHLNNGVYLIRVITPTNTISQKLVVKR